MVRFVRAAAVDEVPPGSMRAAEVGGRRVLLVNVDGELHALDPSCPHRAGPLEDGTLGGAVLECPWHHYRYDVRTGENLYPRNVYPDDLPYLQRDVRPLRRYPVRVEGNEILVAIRAGPPGRPH